MKLHRVDLWKNKTWIVIIPTIIITIDNLLYTERNISLEFHWMIFHVRFMWMKGAVV